jgi:beta-N-acetylhexosaminidase
MDDRILAAQVLMTGIEGNGVLSRPMRELLTAVPAGAVMLFAYNLETGEEGIRSLLAECSALIAGGISPQGVVPFIAVDHEGGSVNRFGTGIGRLPPAASYWDMAQKEGTRRALGAITEGAYRAGRELRDLGITLNLAPVAEVLDGQNRLFLGDRSYGPDADFTSAAVIRFMEGMERAGVSCVLKHFPGNTGTDPHGGVPVLPGGRAVLDLMIRPFAEAIRNHSPSAVMVSHVIVPARDAGRNASLSPLIIREWLREELGFRGVILADDFSMGAVSALGIDSGEAAVAAINAGADMVMTWPLNLAGSHGALLSAVEEGRLPRERLREAVEHILAEKIRSGLM